MNSADFLAADWPAPRGIVAGTTLRTGGVSRGVFDSLNLGAHVGDRSQDVVENRARLARALELPSSPLWLRQRHGIEIARAPSDADEPDADASIAEEPGAVCVVLTADCLPVLFARDDGEAVGAAHAGWRGLAAGVLEATVEAFAVDPARLRVWLGPAISQRAFEVGDEVREQFIEHEARAEEAFARNSRGRWQADLYRLARQRLKSAGVSRIYGGGRCTVREDTMFFSHRRDGPCGRMASLIFRRPI